MKKILHIRSIKIRVTLFTLVILVLGIWSVVVYASRLLQEDMRHLAGDQQFSTVSIVTEHLKDELTSRFSALEEIASAVAPAMLASTNTAQAFLEQLRGVLPLFNNGYFIIDANGMAMASIPSSLGRTGLSYRDRDYALAALKEGKSSVGKPVMGRVLRKPTFSMAVPIRNAQGQVVGALVGSIDLSKPNFLDGVTENRYGKSGGYVLVAAQHRLIVTATDKRRIMEELPAPGINPTIDRRLQGYEGTDLFTNARGDKLLSSSKQLPLAGWYLTASLTADEAFAPIHEMQERMLLAAIVLTLLTACFIWWMLRRQLSPLAVTSNAMVALSNTSQIPPPLPITSQDEIGQLIGGFNRLLEIWGQREAALRENQLRFSEAERIAHLGHWQWDFVSGELVCSDEMFRILEINPSEFSRTHDALLDVVHPDDRDEANRAYARSLETRTPYEISHRICMRDGRIKWVYEKCSSDFDPAGKPLRSIGAMQDITERKVMEDHIRQLAFYDELTGLPNRRLLNDRMRQTMAASKRSGLYGALMFMDLDNFKPINDAHGHGIGDLLLIEVGRRLTECVREVDTVARLGGDEFVVMISSLELDKATSTEQARGVAEKILTRLAAPYELVSIQPGRSSRVIEHRCSASIGVVLFVNHEIGEDILMDHADAAMYQAKKAGRNVVRFYEADGPV